MLNIFIWVLTILDVVIAALLIMLVLVQQSKDSGFGTAFGGMGESVFGVQAQSHLARMTVVFAALFFTITLALGIITGHRDAAKKGIIDREPSLLAKDDGKKPEPGKTSAAVPVASDEESTETLPDGTIVKKVKGGTITMKPVKKEDKPEAKPEEKKPEPAKEGTSVDAPAGSVTVKPAAKEAEPFKETTETMPDGTIVKKVKGGTITMKPVKKDAAPAPKPEEKKAEAKPEAAPDIPPPLPNAEAPKTDEAKPAEEKN